MKTKVILVRGPIGSGKSKIANSFSVEQNKSWFSEDFFWYRNGHYHWDKNRIKESIDWVLLGVKTAIELKYPTIVVCSSEPTWSFIDQLIDNISDCDLTIYRTVGPWTKDNLDIKYRIPTKVITNQIRNYKPVPGEIVWSA